jgi:hypothetical protein
MGEVAGPDGETGTAPAAQPATADAPF